MKRVLFAGGKDVGCGCLEILLARHDVHVCGVVVNDNDMAAGRWYKSAAEIAVARGVPIYRNIYKPLIVDNVKPDLIVVAYYDRILKPDVLAMVPAINVHLALAEEYRGCYPTTWALINGEAHTGVTIHWIDEGIDTGDIIAQQEYEITDRETGQTLYYALTHIAINLFDSMLPSILAGTAPRTPQRTTKNSRHYRRRFPGHEIHFDNDARGNELYDEIRARIFPPFPPPYFWIGQRRMVIVEDNEWTQ